MAYNFVIKDPTIAVSQGFHKDIIMSPWLMQYFGHHNVEDQHEVTVWLVTHATNFYHQKTEQPIPYNRCLKCGRN